MREPRVAAIVVAAGTGTRFGATKQHAELAGRPVWQWARDALVGSGLDPVVVVGPVVGGVPGGERRRDSVAAGLAHVPEGAEFIAVHDAARPLASTGLVRRLIDAMTATSADGVIPGVGVADTIKRINESRMVIETVDRSHLIAAQTPQIFRAASLRAAHAADQLDATDDAALVERWGGTVAVVAGEATNLKITYPADLAMAETLVRDAGL